MIYELDLKTGRERVLDPGRTGQQITPAYHPNGREIAFGLMEYNRTGLFSYDIERDCCLTHIQGGDGRTSLRPFPRTGAESLSPPIEWGRVFPRSMLSPPRGGRQTWSRLTSTGAEGYYTLRIGLLPGTRSHSTAAWAEPVGIIFWWRRSEYRGARVLRLTAEGNNEDPSWAPDGRHLVFAGERNYGYGLFVVDTSTGRDPVPGLEYSAPDPGLVSLSGRIRREYIARGGILRYMPYGKSGPDQTGEVVEVRGVPFFGPWNVDVSFS